GSIVTSPRGVAAAASVGGWLGAAGGIEAIGACVAPDDRKSAASCGTLARIAYTTAPSTTSDIPTTTTSQSVRLIEEILRLEAPRRSCRRASPHRSRARDRRSTVRNHSAHGNTPTAIPTTCVRYQ